MKIAVRQINTIIGDLDGNAEKIRAGYRRAKEAGADLAVFPELSLVGYPPMDLVEKRAFREATTRKASELAAETDSTGLIFGAFDEDDDDVGTNVFNAAFFCFDGAVRGIQHKTLIPNYDVFDEVRYYESAKSADVCHFKGKAIGVSVCEDIWNDKDYWKRRLYPNDPVDQQIKKGADILINISASPYSHGKRVERRDMLATVTRDNKTPLAYACAVGGQTELIFDGASMCFDREGRLVKLGASGEEDFFVFDTEADYEEIVDVEGDFPEEGRAGVGRRPSGFLRQAGIHESGDRTLGRNRLGGGGGVGDEGARRGERNRRHASLEVFERRERRRLVETIRAARHHMSYLVDSSSRRSGRSRRSPPRSDPNPGA